MISSLTGCPSVSLGASPFDISGRSSPRTQGLVGAKWGERQAPGPVLVPRTNLSSAPKLGM